MLDSLSLFSICSPANSLPPAGSPYQTIATNQGGWSLTHAPSRHVKPANHIMLLMQRNTPCCPLLLHTSAHKCPQWLVSLWLTGERENNTTSTHRQFCFLGLLENCGFLASNLRMKGKLFPSGKMKDVWCQCRLVIMRPFSKWAYNWSWVWIEMFGPSVKTPLSLCSVHGMSCIACYIA